MAGKRLILVLVSIAFIECDILSESCYQSVEDELRQYRRTVNGADIDDKYEAMVKELNEPSDDAPSFHMDINQIMEYWDKKQGNRDEALRRPNSDKDQLSLPDLMSSTSVEDFLRKFSDFLQSFIVNLNKFSNTLQKLIYYYYGKGGKSAFAKRFFNDVVETLHFFDGVTKKMNDVLEMYLKSQ